MCREDDQSSIGISFYYYYYDNRYMLQVGGCDLRFKSWDGGGVIENHSKPRDQKN